MAEVDALLSVIRSFLCDTLGSVLLPPAIESQRRHILERMDVALLGRTNSAPETKTFPTPVARRRPLNTVARLFSLSRKRYSMPASLGCPAPVFESSEPPLPPKCPSFIRGSSLEADQEYEVPKTVITSEFHGVLPATLPNASQSRRQHNRLSLSPQLEITRTNQNQLQFPHPAPSVHSNAVPCDNRDDTALTLPKKCSSQARRFSAFMDSAWTLAGLLHHRYKPNKWTRLNLCLLSSGSRLIAYKSTHAMSPSLVLFLCGTSGIYAGRDSGMEYVIKIAHPTRGTTVLAAETEQQALVWIKQINQYSQGITPTDTHSFLEHPILPANMGLNSASSCSVPSTPVRSVLSFVDSTDSAHRDKADAQEDSGFSAPVSSGSEGNSGDGVISGQPHRPSTEVITSHCLSSSTLLLSSSCSHVHPLTTVNSTHDESQITANPVFDSAYSLNSARSTISVSSKPLRREGFLSSMRRKVESLSSKRRARKSLPQTSYEQHPDLPKAGSSSDMNIQKRNSPLWLIGTAVSCTTQAYSLTASSAYTDSLHSDIFGVGYDWTRLEAASSLLSNAESVATSRPHSYSTVNSTCGHASSTVHLSFTSPLTNGPLSDLSSASIGSSRCISSSTATSTDRIIVSGEAYISVPGRLPWTNRWCCLRPRCLEIYPFICHPSCAGKDVDCRRCTCPVFSLTLEPGQVELGLAGDKHHKAALRLAVPKQSKTPLLFDSSDKLQMGAWIRGFIEALGIISADPILSENGMCTAPATLECTRCSPNLKGAEYDVPEHHVESTPRDGASSASPDPFALDNVSVLSADLDSLQIYDEVYPPQYDRRSSERWNSFSHKKRGSSSFTHSNPISGSHDCLKRDSYITGTHSNRWRVPPPSRRLLAQPLPPLPSVGPSGAESMAGTIASSHNSSNLTPDENAVQEADGVVSEPEFGNPSWSSSRRKHSVSLNKRQTSCGSCSPRSSPDASFRVLNTSRRHSSLNSLYYQTPYSEPVVGIASEALNSTRSFHLSPNDLDEVTTVNTSTATDGEHKLTFELASSSRSCGTNTTCTGFPSDLSLPCAEETCSMDWHSRPVPSWPEDSLCTRPINVALAAAAARRSASCVTGTKPTMESQADPRVVSTLPPRHELNSTFLNDFLDPATHLLSNMVPLSPQVDLFHYTSLSPHSAQVTTSSGVATMTNSLSPSKSGGTTHPINMTVPRPQEVQGFHSAQYSDQRSELGGANSPPETMSLQNGSKALLQRSVTRNPSKHTEINGYSESATRSVIQSSDVDYSPMNTSLILVATQLEEVQHGAQKLRSRRENLSFRLSNRLNKQCNGKRTISPQPIVPANSPSLGVTVPDSDQLHIGIGEHHDASREDDENDEATASLYARLAAIEMLISQAASMEARLRDEMIRYLPYASCTPDLQSGTSHQLAGAPFPPDEHPTIPDHQTHRRRGRSYRNWLSPNGSSNGSFTATSNVISNAHSRGRGRGGRMRRRRYGGPAFTNVRHRGQSWNKPDASPTLPVALSPMV